MLFRPSWTGCKWSCEYEEVHPPQADRDSLINNAGMVFGREEIGGAYFLGSHEL